MSKIINTMKILGYSPNKDGVCFGIAMMSSQAIIRDQSQTFIDRINFIKNASEEEIQSLAEPFDRKIKKYLHEKKVDLCCFFDELSIYQGKESVNKEFTSLVPSQRFDNVKRLADAQENDQYVYPTMRQNIIDIFTYGEFFDFIMKIKNHFAGHSFSMIISHSTNDHATQIGFDRKQKQWVSSDHDYVVAGSDKFDDIKKVIDNIFVSHKYLYDRTYKLIVSLDIILSEKYETNVREEIDLSLLKKNNFSLEKLTGSFNKKELSHVIASYEYASRHDELMAIFDKIKSLKLPEKENIQLLESKRTTGMTLFHFLIEKDEAKALQALFKKVKEMQLGLGAILCILGQQQAYFPPPLLIYALKYKCEKVIQVVINAIKTIKNERLRSKLLDTRDSDGFSPLLIAAYGGNEKIVQALLDGIASIKDDQLRAKLLETHSGDGVTPLFIAATMGDSEVAQALIDVISNIADDQTRANLLEARISDGYSVLSALLVATQKGYTEIVQSLTSAISSVDDCQLRAKLLETKDCDGFCALLTAAKAGDKEILEALISAIHGIKDNQLRAKLLKSTSNDGLSVSLIAPKKEVN